ncbi:MAG TPA: NRDE family protein, partial [Pyrinomonadaceae bacterium]|nr:NRDE family protein [Pyrinomonadaceae bacterium]
MCVIYVAFGQRADRPLILIANRDEFYERPTAAAAWWDNAPNIFAGRDLVSGGTWLGVTKDGRFAAVTNYRDPNAPIGKRSRGLLVSDFLRSSKTPSEYLAEVSQVADDYSGFNLLAGRIDQDQ